MHVTSRQHEAAGIAWVWLLGLPVVCVLVYLASLEWRAERFSQRLSGAAPVARDGLVPPPLMEGPLRRMVRAPAPFEADPATTRATLREALNLRPLYAPTWLDLAELEHRLGNADAAAGYATHARRLWPAHPGLSWRVVEFHVRTGATHSALEALRDYWRLVPHHGARVLALASRLERDPHRLYQAVVPEPMPPGTDAGYHPRQFQDYARRSRDARMAIAGWRSAPRAFREDHAQALRFIDFMLTMGRITESVDAWRELTGAATVSATIHNPGFESPLLGGGFGWRAHDPAGAAVAVDAGHSRSGRHSLRVEFDGTDNLNFHHLRQTLVIEPGARYRLVGWWRGEEITTRSGVFVDIRSLDAEANTHARTADRYGSWDWQPFELEFETPPDAALAELRVRRAPTDALDRRIEGRVWFDDLALERLPG